MSSRYQHLHLIHDCDGGGPEDPMLEQRVTRLEEILKRLEPKITEIALTGAKQTDLSAMRVDMAELKGRVANLPSTWTLMSFTLAACLASAGLAFTIARLLGS